MMKIVQQRSFLDLMVSISKYIPLTFNVEGKPVQDTNGEEATLTNSDKAPMGRIFQDNLR
jgi:hypothetical protein